MFWLLRMGAIMAQILMSDIPNRLEEYRREAVQYELAQWSLTKDDCRKSNYKILLDAISGAAKSWAIAENVEYSLYKEGLDHGIDAVRGAILGVSHLDGSVSLEKMAWLHKRQPLYDIRANKVPEIDRPEVEAATGAYLSLPYRSEAIDRLFVDILVAMELYAFGDEMFNEPCFPGLTPRSPLKQRHAFFTYCCVNGSNGLLFGVIGGAAFFAASHGWIGWSWAAWIAGACAILFFLLFVLSTVALPYNWKRVTRGKRRVIELLERMNHTYTALKSDGPISAHHISDLVRSAADAGVIWPAPLYALLDDILRRSARL